MVKLHLILALAWAVLAVPTVLFWSDSVLFVSLVSLYTVALEHWNAYLTARAERKLSEKVAQHDAGTARGGPDA